MNKGEFDATAILSVKANQEIIEKTNATKFKKNMCQGYTQNAAINEIGTYFLFHEEHTLVTIKLWKPGIQLKKNSMLNLGNYWLCIIP